MKQRLGSFWLTLTLTLGLICITGAVASAKSFTLINAGTTTIYHLYVSRASSNYWEYPDVLGEDVLPPGNETTITFPPGSFDTCYWDIAVVYTDGHRIIGHDEDLCTYDQFTARY